MLRCRQTLGALALSFALLAPCPSVAERNVDSALRKASQSGDLPEIRHQLELGAEPNQAYALVAAVQGNQLEAVKYLLAHGANPNAWTSINLRVPVGAATRRTASDAGGIGGLPEFQKQQAAARVTFEQVRAQASASRAGAPSMVIAPAAAKVQTGSVTVHRSGAPPAVGGGMMSHP